MVDSVNAVSGRIKAPMIWLFAVRLLFYLKTQFQRPLICHVNIYVVLVACLLVSTETSGISGEDLAKGNKGEDRSVRPCSVR
ncbi:hypothetical protein EDB82DRAFT_508168 [Fusarium venenatum]|uniref:uncharacterized protein n=1 Tax=Fusarium venenatum TaxID=56646 RepID=UPI001D82AFAF|nr:hypothetical protein EDB82DRAFT_508168 [Fusarium venenatum]